MCVGQVGQERVPVSLSVFSSRPSISPCFDRILCRPRFSHFFIFMGKFMSSFECTSPPLCSRLAGRGSKARVVGPPQTRLVSRLMCHTTVTTRPRGPQHGIRVQHTCNEKTPPSEALRPPSPGPARFSQFRAEACPSLLRDGSRAPSGSKFDSTVTPTARHEASLPPDGPMRVRSKFLTLAITAAVSAPWFVCWA